MTFDNLGEAAEQQLGAATPTGGHYSVTTALPIVLAELSDAGTRATFFVEGINAETYPEALQEIVAAGHECAYHAWRHEEWHGLSDAEEDENLSRGIAAMRSRGLEPTGFRPPGGLIGERTPELLRAHRITYCSPAGRGVSTTDGLVLLPFAWRNVDAYHLLPQFAALRRLLDGSSEPGGTQAAAAALSAAVQEAIACGGHATLVLHTWLIEAERDAVRDVLASVRDAARRGDVWAARCDEVARWVDEHARSFASGSELDETSWLDPR